MNLLSMLLRQLPGSLLNPECCIYMTEFVHVLCEMENPLYSALMGNDPFNEHAQNKSHWAMGVEDAARGR